MCFFKALTTCWVLLVSYMFFTMLMAMVLEQKGVVRASVNIKDLNANTLLQLCA